MKPRQGDIVDIIRLQLGIDVVEADNQFFEDLSATSADIVNIVATIEERYGLEIDDIDLAEVTTVKELVAVVEEKWADKA